jgi:phosphate transport system protein
MTMHFEREIDRLKRDLLSLSARVEDALRQAVQAVHERDAELGRSVARADDEIDALEVELEEDCLKVLALYQPVAHDMRLIVAILKINNDLERIGDLASTLGKRAADLAARPGSRTPVDIHSPAEIAQRMLTWAMDAFVREDVALARKVLGTDDEIDALHRDAFAQTVKAMQASPEDIELQLDTLSVSKALERIGDHATNIAEDVIYLHEGAIVRHQGA